MNSVTVHRFLRSIFLKAPPRQETNLNAIPSVFRAKIPIEGTRSSSFRCRTFLL